MKKRLITTTMKTAALSSLGLLVFFQLNVINLPLPIIIGANLFIFALFVLGDLLFEQKPWLLKGLQLYISIMLFIIAILEMHHVISSICVLSIALLPRLINELI
ncbi:dolichol kinase [Bacillus fengqiuensis]|nr:dolichol kinase [Bacillus fengqiuensis]